MKPPNNNTGATIDILVGVIPTIILYGNFIVIGLVYGISDITSLKNPIDQVFVISVGSIIGFAGLILSLGRSLGRAGLYFNSLLLIIGIITVSYVLVSLYTEPDSPDTLLEKLYLAPLFASLVVGLKRLLLMFER